MRLRRPGFRWFDLPTHVRYGLACAAFAITGCSRVPPGLPAAQERTSREIRALDACDDNGRLSAACWARYWHEAGVDDRNRWRAEGLGVPDDAAAFSASRDGWAP